MQSNEHKVGIILMTYGSATTAEHVEEYLEHIYHGTAPEALVRDFENRYRLIGHSPLVEITEKQAEILQKNLGDNYAVQSGMLHSAPFIEQAVGICHAKGAVKLLGIILSPQFSSFIMDGYGAAFNTSAKKYGFLDTDIKIADAWPTEKHFIELLRNRVQESLEKLQTTYGRSIPVIFTTHSLPERVVDKDPQYLQQLHATTSAVVAALNEPTLEWYSAYQSAGHTPEKWLKPDIVDLLPLLREKKAPAVLIVPIQFLADHLEILYDLDIAAKKQCAEYGLSYHRVKLPNTDPLFIKALETIVTAYAPDIQ